MGTIPDFQQLCQSDHWYHQEHQIHLKPVNIWKHIKTYQKRNAGVQTNKNRYASVNLKVMLSYKLLNYVILSCSFLDCIVPPLKIHIPSAKLHLEQHLFVQNHVKFSWIISLTMCLQSCKKYSLINVEPMSFWKRLNIISSTILHAIYLEQFFDRTSDKIRNNSVEQHKCGWFSVVHDDNM